MSTNDAEKRSLEKKICDRSTVTRHTQPIQTFDKNQPYRWIFSDLETMERRMLLIPYRDGNRKWNMTTTLSSTHDGRLCGLSTPEPVTRTPMLTFR